MIRKSIDIALNNRLLVLGGALVLFVWGIISFHNLPIEAYPDVADTYVQIITQWPGHAAEEVEQQITVPLEVQLNGVAHLTHLRSVSLSGLSMITIIYDDDITTFNARQEVLDRLGQVTLPPNVNPGIGPDYSPTGQIMFYTLTSTNPKYDVMELKTLNDWFVVNQLKSVPNIVDVNPFGGPTREYQVQVDAGKLVSYGLSLAQVETALAANNINAGGGFIERGEQALNVRAVGLMETTDDIAATVVKVQNGTPVRVRDLGKVVQAPRVRLGQLGRAIHNDDGTIIDSDDVVEGIVLLRKGAVAETTLAALHQKIDELNGTNGHHGLLPVGVKFVPHLDRSELMKHTTHTVFVPGECAQRADCGHYHPLLAFVCRDSAGSAADSREPVVSGRARLRHGGGRVSRDGREHSAPHFIRRQEEIVHGDHCGRRPRSAEARVFRAHYHHRFLPAHLYAAAG
jgi:cobalt-zinc-cadmium resistance protein CzcA